MFQSHHQLLSSHFTFPLPLSHPQNPLLSHLPISPSLYRPTTTLSIHLRTRPAPCLAQATTSPDQFDGPIELLPSTPSVFATDDDPSTLQVTTSVLLTGAISIFLFRSLRRRAKRAKELKFRSSGVKKSIKEEAIESLKAMTPTSIETTAPPSAAQALLGGLSAGVIALILYKFTTTIEASLNRQTLSDNFSVRQITVTIRTIINGLCYLATFVFGINSVGLVLYSGQLAFNSFMDDDSSSSSSSSDKIESNTEGLYDSPNPTTSDSAETSSDNTNQSSDSKQ